MKRSTTSAKRPLRLWAVLFWLLIWHLASLAIGQEILLVSPVSVVIRLSELARQQAFWSAILFSFLRIAAGFLVGVLLSVAFAGLSARFRLVRELLAPLILTIRSTPVASFIILALIWIPSRNLSVFISLLMVLPILYANVMEGIESTDPLLLEMAALFRVPFGRKLRYIYVSQVLPFFRAACGACLGLCWKAGIAAEVIGIPKGSMGERLYQAKIFLNTPDLFAWTLTIIAVSLLFEKCFLFALDRLVMGLEGTSSFKKKGGIPWPY